jgi:hypothetical protein
MGILLRQNLRQRHHGHSRRLHLLDALNTVASMQDGMFSVFLIIHIPPIILNSSQLLHQLRPLWSKGISLPHLPLGRLLHRKHLLWNPRSHHLKSDLLAAVVLPPGAPNGLFTSRLCLCHINTILPLPGILGPMCLRLRTLFHSRLERPFHFLRYGQLVQRYRPSLRRLPCFMEILDLLRRPGHLVVAWYPLFCFAGCQDWLCLPESYSFQFSAWADLLCICW